MHPAACILCILLVIELALRIRWHGKPWPEPLRIVNVWRWCWTNGIVVALLWWGGFFDSVK